MLLSVVKIGSWRNRGNFETTTKFLSRQEKFGRCRIKEDKGGEKREMRREEENEEKGGRKE